MTLCRVQIVNLKEYEQKLRKEIEIEKEYKQLPNLKSQSTILKEDHLRKVRVGRPFERMIDIAQIMAIFIPILD